MVQPGAPGSGGGGSGREPGPYEEEEPSLLVVILDADPASWAQLHAIGERARQEGGGNDEAAAALTTFPRLIDALLLFLDAHLLTHRANRVAVLAAAPHGTAFLYPPPAHHNPPTSSDAGLEEGAAAQAAGVGNGMVDRVGQAVADGLKRLLASSGEEGAEVDGDGDGGGQQRVKRWRQGSLVAQALSKGLCYIQRALREQASLSARLLVLQASPDAHADYNALMNCIFSAHRSAVPIDACALGFTASHGPRDSSFLQQAAYITGGIYVRPERQDALLQHFLTLFLPGQRLRQILRLPKQESVDFRAACFCHRRAVEQAYVCSVCLSIFCAYSPECATCGTPARPPKGSQQGQQQKKPAIPAAIAAAAAAAAAAGDGGAAAAEENGVGDAS